MALRAVVRVDAVVHLAVPVELQARPALAFNGLGRDCGVGVAGVEGGVDLPGVVGLQINGVGVAAMDDAGLEGEIAHALRRRRQDDDLAAALGDGSPVPEFLGPVLAGGLPVGAVELLGDEWIGLEILGEGGGRQKNGGQKDWGEKRERQEDSEGKHGASSGRRGGERQNHGGQNHSEGPP